MSRSSSKRWWMVYAGCAAVVLGALIWVTARITQLEASEARAWAESAHQEEIRLALWRMDSWLGTRLATEAARPYYEYHSAYDPSTGVRRVSGAADVSGAPAPSPLLLTVSTDFPLHFQLSESEGLTSPQIPGDSWGDLAGGDIIDPAILDERMEVLSFLFRLLGRDDLGACVAESESRASVPIEETIALRIPTLETSMGAAGRSRSKAEYSKRKGVFYDNVQNVQQNNAAEQTLLQDTAEVSVGPLVPLWLRVPQLSSDPSLTSVSNEVSAVVSPVMTDTQPQPDVRAALVFIRRVRISDDEVFQGFLANWNSLGAQLLSEVGDLTREANLTPVMGTHDEDGSMLASVPARLQVPFDPSPTGIGWSTGAWTLLMMWIAVLAALAVVAVTLRSIIDTGERRQRFGSTVTHELRTPLTTFTMYTEMLADGVISEPQKRQEYLETLKQEANRLASLVENVLSYARLEDGRRKHRTDVTAVGDLLARVTPALAKRAEDAGLRLVVTNTVPTDSLLRTDTDVVGQILFNLVDNACKYGKASGKDASSEVTLEVSRNGKSVSLAVEDEGEGIDATAMRRIFSPFERANTDPSQPGIGLGLALSRGLARDLGGELVFRPQRDRAGARFELMLPA